jgi:leucyl/phenylalanyl-tRNA--protein transferase
MRKQPFTITFDKAFKQVIEQCSLTRQNQEGTWITDDMQNAYCKLHQQGTAHSVEVWQGEQVVGGLYGLGIGNIFFGESMFSHVNNSSKVAFCYLVNQLRIWGYTLIDCQVHSKHLESLGAIEIDRNEFQSYLSNINIPSVSINNRHWEFDHQLSPKNFY